MLSRTKTRIEKLTSLAGHPVKVLCFEGEIDGNSKESILGAYQSLPKQTTLLILLDFTGVDSINSSGVALIIQLLIESSNSGQKVALYGLSPHYAKVFSIVGITKFTDIYSTQAEALASL